MAADKASVFVGEETLTEIQKYRQNIVKAPVKSYGDMWNSLLAFQQQISKALRSDYNAFQ